MRGWWLSGGTGGFMGLRRLSVGLMRSSEEGRITVFED